MSNTRATIKNISIVVLRNNKVSGECELAEIRIDWSNDRHQAVGLRRLDANGVENALLELAGGIAFESRSGEI